MTRTAAAMFAIVFCCVAVARSTMAENSINARLLGLTAVEQAAILAGIVGGGCLGKAVFYMGGGTSGFAKDKAFWSLRCLDGREFAIEARPDGSTIVVDCAVLKTFNDGQCFEKLSN